jgi:hypothetical protein
MTFPTYYEARQQNDGLAIRGTEHLFTVFAVYEDGANVKRVARAENCTEDDAHTFCGALERRDDMTVNHTKRSAVDLARSFAAEWLRPSDPDHATLARVDTLSTAMLAFHAVVRRVETREMARASDLIDNADDGTAYQLGLISLALITRKFLRDCGWKESEQS